jgi:hydroxymethylbilane synthase
MTSISRPVIRLGTRGSALALWQADEVTRLLNEAFPAVEIERVIITTSGDVNQHGSLADIGGKALFARELEEALLAHEIDIAVHSLKDMETQLPDGLVIPCTLPREDTCDALVCRHYASLDALPAGAKVGTSSVRRAAQLRHIRPDLEIMPFRGNVPTRIEKLQRGDVDATLLAIAGLKRLGLEQHVTELLDESVFLPAVSQGAIGVECRADDGWVMEVLSHIHDEDTFVRITAERACLNTLNGSCRTPVGVHAMLEHGQLHLQAKLYSNDGKECYGADASGCVDEADAIGRKVGAALLSMGKHLLEA